MSSSSSRRSDCSAPSMWRSGERQTSSGRRWGTVTMSSSWSSVSVCLGCRCSVQGCKNNYICIICFLSTFFFAAGRCHNIIIASRLFSIIYITTKSNIIYFCIKNAYLWCEEVLILWCSFFFDLSFSCLKRHNSSLSGLTFNPHVFSCGDWKYTVAELKVVKYNLHECLPFTCFGCFYFFIYM